MIEKWQENQTTGIRHWPAMAYASNDYRFRQQEFARYGKPPSQSDIRNSLSTIAGSAGDLHTALTKLQGFASQLNDGVVPLAIPHLVWIDQYIAQAAAGVFSTELVENPTVIAEFFCERTKLLERIMGVAVAATVSIDRTPHFLAEAAAESTRKSGAPTACIGRKTNLEESDRPTAEHQ